MLGIVLAITAAFCWGISTVYARLGLDNIRVSTGTLISMFSSVLLVGLLALVIDFNNFLRLSPLALGWFALVGIVNNVLGRQFNYGAIKYLGATRASSLIASSPLFALLIAVTLIGESINVPILIGTLVSIGGLYLVVTSE